MHECTSWFTNTQQCIPVAGTRDDCIQAYKHHGAPSTWVVVVQELVDAVVLACSKTRALCTLGLAILQKLFSNDLLSTASRKKAIALLRAVSRSKSHDDEAIKLKLLQTCFTTLQMPQLSADGEDTREVCVL